MDMELEKMVTDARRKGKKDLNHNRGYDSVRLMGDHGDRCTEN